MANDVRVKVTLSCTECKQRNYNTTKNKRNNPDRIEMMKYCKFCKKETLHKETKQFKGQEKPKWQKPQQRSLDCVNTLRV